MGTWMSDKPIEELNLLLWQGRSCSAFLFSVAADWHLGATAYNPMLSSRWSHILPPLHIVWVLRRKSDGLCPNVALSCTSCSNACRMKYMNCPLFFILRAEYYQQCLIHTPSVSSFSLPLQLHIGFAEMNKGGQMPPLIQSNLHYPYRKLHKLTGYYTT